MTLVSVYPKSHDANDALDNVRTFSGEMGKPADYASFRRQAGRPISVSAEDSLSYSAAESQYSNGNTAAALTGFNNYIQKFPDGVYALDANYYRGELYNAKKDWSNALSGYEAVASQAPNKY